MAGLLATPMVAFSPAPASAQTLLEAFFGRGTFSREAPPQRQRVIRRVERKKVYRSSRASRQERTTRRRTASQSSRSSSRKASASRQGTYRTLCVRKADGYFFPISFSTTSDYFPKDLESCQARCPGAEVDLYVHRVLLDETEQMVNYKTDEPYTALATAFAYRTEGLSRAAAEACRIKPDHLRIDVAEDLGPMPFDAPIPMPGWRPDPNQLRDEGVDDALRGGTTEMAEVSNRPKIIRRVGPRFFPDQ